MAVRDGSSAKHAGFDWTERPIILADSDPFSRRLTRDIFRYANAEHVIACEDAQEALRHVEEYLDPILVVSWRNDEAEPDGGPQLVRALRQSKGRESTPVLMVTARRNLIDIEKARDCGADSLSLRPLAPKHIIERMGSITQRSREFVKSTAFVGPDRRANRPMRGAPKRQSDIHDGRVSPIQAAQNQARSIIFDSLRHRDKLAARVGRSLEKFICQFNETDPKTSEIIELHRSALARLKDLHQSDTQARVSVVMGLEQLVERQAA